MKRYFYISIHFSLSCDGAELTDLGNNLYRSEESGDIYRKRLLYDFGWGQENGYEALPQLPFAELIKLVEHPVVTVKKNFWGRYAPEQVKQYDIWRSNLYGAVAVIMQDHTEALIAFLSEKIDMDYFDNPGIRENFKHFTFDSQKAKKAGKIPGGVGTKTYEDILNMYPDWTRIAPCVIKQIYGE